jgi:hypothetical protein
VQDQDGQNNNILKRTYIISIDVIPICFWGNCLSYNNIKGKPGKV